MLFRQIHFAIWTNIFVNSYKYILHLQIYKNVFRKSRQRKVCQDVVAIEVGEAAKENTFCYSDKYIKLFGQIHF